MKKKLHIGVLDFSTLTPKTGSGTNDGTKAVRTLFEVIKNEGHNAIIYKAEKCQMYFHGRKFEVLYNNKKLKDCDVLIPKFILSNGVDLAATLIAQFQNMNIPVVNGYLPIVRAKNKLRTLQILAHHGIPVPKTVIVRKRDFIDEAVESIGGYPVVVKIPFGAAGSGVLLAESSRGLYSIFDINWSKNESDILLFQEFIKESNGDDYRAFVVGDEVVASMKRSARNGDFRSNLHQGGQGNKVTLTAEEEKIAIKASKALGLQMAGVDILRSKNGPLIMEVNANPGFLGISKVTGINVPKKIVQYAASLVK